MRITTPVVAALAAAAFLAPAANAQIQAFGGQDEDRMASTLIFAETSNGFSPKGGVSVSYSQPDWKDSYDKVLESGKFNGTNQRLGKNWWTTLDTTVPLEIGGTKIKPGAYYLGIHVDDGGKFTLLVIDAKKAMTTGMAPFVPKGYQSEYEAPLQLAKNSLEETQKKMMIEITANDDDASVGKFSIRWGKHELSAPVKFHLGGPKDASSDK